MQPVQNGGCAVGVTHGGFTAVGLADWGRLGALLLPDKGRLTEACAEWGRCLLPLKPWFCTDPGPLGCHIWRCTSPSLPAAPPCMPGPDITNAATPSCLLVPACVSGADAGPGGGCDADPGGVAPLSPPVDRLILEA